MNSSNVRQYLEQISSMTKDSNFKSLESFILEKGESFDSEKYPAKYQSWRGKMKDCFKNAFWLAIENEDLTYVEGYALSIIPVLHAWCVDKQNRVIDPTWPDQENCQYYGVKFEKEFVRKFITKSKIYGLLGGDWRSAREIIENKQEFHQAIISKKLKKIKL